MSFLQAPQRIDYTKFRLELPKIKQVDFNQPTAEVMSQLIIKAVQDKAEAEKLAQEQSMPKMLKSVQPIKSHTRIASWTVTRSESSDTDTELDSGDETERYSD